MGLFGTRRPKENLEIRHQKLGKYDKINQGKVENSVLTAVSELQPFEQAFNGADGLGSGNQRQSYLLANSHNLVDIFGAKITNSDMSNPTRARNERPLDTIRSFEYAITGDATYRDQLELHRLGWGFHEDFPHYNLQRPQGGYVDSQMGAPSNPRPQYNFNSTQQGVYQAPTTVQPTEPKKKKRGLFGRKK